MSNFVRENLPNPACYFQSEGLTLMGARSAKWKTTRCDFHGGSDSMRINSLTGAWCCMACGEKGGDVLGYHMAAHDMEFIEAAKALGAWHDDGKPHAPQRPKPLPAGQAIAVLAFECTFIAHVAGSIVHGVRLTKTDFQRVAIAAGRIDHIAGAYK